MNNNSRQSDLNPKLTNSNKSSIAKSENKTLISTLVNEEEIIKTVSEYGLENDKQTISICKFTSIATQFSTLSFRDKIETIPVLINNIEGLVVKMNNEIKEYGDIAIQFKELVSLYAKLILNTKHDLSMKIPNFEKLIFDLEIMNTNIESSSLNLKQNNIVIDSFRELSNHCNGIKNEIDLIENKLKIFESCVQEKITLINKRVFYANFSPGLASFAGALGGCFFSNAFFSTSFLAGLSTMGSIAFPPIGIAILAALLGGVALGTIVFLIKKMWIDNQKKALKYLIQIADNINKLKISKLEFLQQINMLREQTNKLIIDLDILLSSKISSAQKGDYVDDIINRKLIDSTKLTIQTIENINKIDMGTFINQSDQIESFSL